MAGVQVGRVRVLLLAVFALACVAGLLPGGAAALAPPVSGLVPGVVEPPALGLALHGDVVWHQPATASASSGPVDKQVIETPDHLRVKVETSSHYLPSLEYDENLVAFLDSLEHGQELNGLRVFVATPAEMIEFCGGAAAACYVPKGGVIYIVGQASFGGFPTSYVLAHEYGHRIENFRHNTPFPGGALVWGTKRWDSVEGVCQGTVDGDFAPGDEGRGYFENPGEAFAESYAWSRFGSGIVQWRWTQLLHPSAAAYAAIEEDVLDPWVPLRSEKQGQLKAGRRIYRLRPKNDGLLRVAMTGNGEGGDLDLALLDAHGNLLASSTRPGGSSEHLNYVVCGDRDLRLAVIAPKPPGGGYRLQIVMP